jgi:hypothetical protein
MRMAGNESGSGSELVLFVVGASSILMILAIFGFFFGCEWKPGSLDCASWRGETCNCRAAYIQLT